MQNINLCFYYLNPHSMPTILQVQKLSNAIRENVTVSRKSHLTKSKPTWRNVHMYIQQANRSLMELILPNISAILTLSLDQLHPQLSIIGCVCVCVNFWRKVCTTSCSSQPQGLSLGPLHKRIQSIRNEPFRVYSTLSAVLLYRLCLTT